MVINECRLVACSSKEEWSAEKQSCRVSALMGVKESTLRHLLSQLLLIGLNERRRRKRGGKSKRDKRGAGDRRRRGRRHVSEVREGELVRKTVRGGKESQTETGSDEEGQGGEMKGHGVNVRAGLAGG